MKRLVNRLLLLIFTPLTFSSLFFTNQVVFATSSLSVSISSNTVNMNLLPGQFGTANQTISVSTDSAAGYEVTLTTTGTSSALVDELDSSKAIPTFTLPNGSDSIPATSLGYGYGYSIDNGTNYRPIPEPSLSPTRLFYTSTAGSNNHVITFGAKIPPNLAQGTYTNTFTIDVIANLEACPAGNICYYGNQDDGNGSMDNQIATSNTITLMASNFSRPGYGFAGWNTAIDGSGTNYGPNQEITTGDLSVTGLQLYAKWVQSTGTLQEWDGCSSLNENEVIALTDSRDGNTYAVTKYADNRCWIMENLRLDLSNSNLQITNLNTNKPTADFIQAVNAHPASSNSFCTNENRTCINQVFFNRNNTNRNLTASYNTNNTSSSWYSYGNYYNWYTITAGNGTYDLSTAGAEVNGDICPSNWKLPTGFNSTGELALLDIALGGNGINQTSGTQGGVAASVRWRTYPYNFIYSGEQKGNSAANRGSSSSYATLNTSNATRTINLWLKSDGLYMSGNNTIKTRGQTARCIYNENHYANGNIHYDANGGTGTMADQTNVNFGTTLAANNSFTKAYSYFYAWNTSADGSGIAVTEGSTIAGAADYLNLSEGDTLTLYAIWHSQYTLAYDGNNADEGSMSNVGVSNLEIGNQTLVASNYSRVGYGFAGWSLDNNAGTKLANGQAVTVYGPNETIAIDNTFLGNANQQNQITLYAVWIPEDTTYTMQTFTATNCTNMSSGEIIALKDTRNNDVYSVTKLEDGNCWMMENLRLDPSTTTFSSSNTNLPTNDFITNAPNSSTANILCNTDDSACIDTISFNTNNIKRNNITVSHNANNSNSSWYSYGIMYNWYTASAGNGTYSMSTGNVQGDICPLGWRLPTGGTSGEFVTLNNLANSGSTKTDTGLTKFPDNFIYSGDYNHNTAGGRNNYGRFWSSTPDGNNKAFRLGIVASGATPSGSWGKWDAFAIRCIVK